MTIFFCCADLEVLPYSLRAKVEASVDTPLHAEMQSHQAIISFHQVKDRKQGKHPDRKPSHDNQPGCRGAPVLVQLLHLPADPPMTYRRESVNGLQHLPTRFWQVLPKGRSGSQHIPPHDSLLRIR